MFEELISCRTTNERSIERTNIKWPIPIARNATAFRLKIMWDWQSMEELSGLGRLHQKKPTTFFLQNLLTVDGIRPRLKGLNRLSVRPTVPVISQYSSWHRRIITVVVLLLISSQQFCSRQCGLHCGHDEVNEMPVFLPLSICFYLHQDWRICRVMPSEHNFK